MSPTRSSRSPFAVGPVISGSIRPFEGLFTEAFLGSFFAPLSLIAPSAALLAMIAPLAIHVFSCEVGETGGLIGRRYGSTFGIAPEQTGGQKGIQGLANGGSQAHDEDEEEEMRAEWILILLAFAAGTAVPVQFAVNAAMRGVVGGPVLAAAISFVVGTLALLVAVLVAREGAPSLSDLAGAPWWAWAGGFLGAFYVTASIILTPRLGAAATVGFIIAGQVVMSVILDRFGLLNLPVQLITLPKLGGAVLVIVGAVLVLRS